MSAGVDAPAATRAAGAGPAAGHRPALDPAWYDAIAARRSRRRYSDRKVAPAALDALRAFCDRFQLAPGARAALVRRRRRHLHRPSRPLRRRLRTRRGRPVDGRLHRAAGRRDAGRLRGRSLHPRGDPARARHLLGRRDVRPQGGRGPGQAAPRRARRRRHSRRPSRRAQAVRGAHDEQGRALRRPPAGRGDRAGPHARPGARPVPQGRRAQRGRPGRSRPWRLPAWRRRAPTGSPGGSASRAARC